MPTNPYFNFYQEAQEQTLLEDLGNEMVFIHGMDMIYCPRTGVNEDKVINEYGNEEFNSHYVIEGYLKNFDAFEGDGQLMSKFGLEIRDQITVCFMIRRFTEIITNETDIKRPREGDIIYVPMLGAAYQIKFEESAQTFFQLGQLTYYQPTAELLEFNNQVFNTGYSEIDDKYSKDYEDVKINEEYEDNEEYDTESESILDFSEKSPFSER